MGEVRRCRDIDCTSNLIRSQAGGGGAKAQARNMLMDAQRVAANGGKPGDKKGSQSTKEEPTGTDPRLRAPERQPVNVSPVSIRGPET